ncbi:ABC transporter substrate-binding protein [Dactylosporangium aurantiacum]|uniref:ABC transporter substrate-binding protein n=1 Tax=Dactylosporangium aurantiacum TaxID=35754 RepID=A0A9Q9IBB6_9ACTN|nr:ABC transporter substrate-binding protein [Dactylosporangium aurantiacum]MDG6107305.1 ABC transporter substrate-binding protein [Dactylosporangium aurantiacum]UWZ51168.1 ABC transporter substrate-binding protein [Dactylosporangium aurantiacum]
MDRSPVSATGVPKRGGTLQLAASADAQPGAVMANRAGNWMWRRLVFEPLAEFDAQRQPQPVLAKSWTFNAERTGVVLELRDDVKFHSGRPMTAEDVVFSLEQVKDAKNASQLRAVALKLTKVEATGPHQVTITLARPTDSLFDLFHLTMVVDKETFAKIGDGSQVVGTGPFVWKQWKPGASITLERNPAYRDADRPYLDKVEIAVITDPTALQTALRGGRSHLVNGLSTADIKALREDRNFALENAGGVFYPLGLNVTAAPFDKKEVRQAVGWALDRERIKAQVFGGDATVTDLWWTPEETGYPKDLATRYSLDVAKAKALVEQAGAKGARVPIAFANLPTMKNLFEIVRFNLEQIGLAPEAVALDTAEFDARQVKGTLGPAFLLLHGMVGFSAATIVDAMPSLRAGNPSQFTAAQYDQLRATLQEAGDGAKGTALAGLSTYLLDESFSHVTMVAPQYHVRSATLQGVRTVALGSVVATDAFLAA